MDDLSKKLKISKKTLYNCFSNKNELVKHTIYQHFTEIESNLNTIEHLPISEIAKMWKGTQFAVQQLSKVHNPLIEDLKKYYPEIHSELTVQREKMIIDHIGKNIMDGRKNGYYRNDFNVEIISQLFAHQILFITERWASANVNLAINAVVEFSEYHLRGISTLKGLTELNTLTSNENQ